MGPNPRTLGMAITAFSIARQAHQGQFRADGVTPYIVHPEDVTFQVEQHYQDVDTRPIAFCAAMTHDVLEDSGKGKGSKKFVYEDLVQLLGKEVADVVRELTKIEGLPKNEQRARMIEGCKTMSHMAKFIKLADRLCNMRDMRHMSEKFIARYCDEARQMVANMKGTHPPFEQMILTIADSYDKKGV